MSKTPNFDSKIKMIIDVMPQDNDAEICRKFQVPPIGMEPDKLLDYLNGFNTGLAFFWKPHMTTGRPLLSAIHPDNPIPIVSEDEWASADYTSAAQEIDPTRSVMDQLWDLVTTVPHNPTRCVQAVNSIAIGCVGVQNCYCVAGSHLLNRCFYTYAIIQGEDCIDVGNGIQVARSYQCGGSNEISDCQFVYESRACLNSSFLFDCWNCDSCFGATNQRHKKYIWFNEQLSKEEYQQRVGQIDLSDADVVEAYWQKFFTLWKSQGVWPFAFSVGNTEAEGEHLFGCVRCDGCFLQSKSTDCYRCRFGLENSGCAYTSGGGYEQDCYLSTGGGYGAKNKFCAGTNKCISCEYCHNCRDCENCFACVGLQRKKFCVFNKQYTEEEYWPLVDELKTRMLASGEYGRFFEAKFSPSGFQYSAGELYVSYSAQRLREYDAPTFDPRRGQVLGPQPTDQAIYDPEIGRYYTITSVERQMYKAKHWPLPRKHFVTRLTELIRLSNSPIVEEAVCGLCAQAIVTYRNFSFPERTVYCNECYLKFLETK